MSGCRFYAGYTITPASEIMEIMARRMPQVGGVFIQFEDEIASINAIIGASWAGLKAMTATSGPGFSLMQEGIGLAIMTETPIVIVDTMRAGPSTGIPTKSTQGDIMQSRWGSHGHYEIVTYAPSTIQEVYDVTIEAFNTSEKYRVPVIVTMDGLFTHLRESLVLRDVEEVTIVNRKTPKVPPEEYLPYKPDEDLVPPMANFGEGYYVFVEALAHNYKGYYDETSYCELVKRLSDKILKNVNDIVRSKSIFTEDAETLIVAYGAISRPVRAYVKMKRKQGEKFGLFRPLTIWPLDKSGLLKAAKKAKRVFVFEGNYGQLYLEVDRVLKDKEVYLIPWLKVGVPSIYEVEEAMNEWVKK